MHWYKNIRSGGKINEIETTLRVLEKATSWNNKSELYIGIIKEAVSKYMKYYESSLALWRYFVDRISQINNFNSCSLFEFHGYNAHTSLTRE